MLRIILYFLVYLLFLKLFWFCGVSFWLENVRISCVNMYIVWIILFYVNNSCPIKFQMLWSKIQNLIDKFLAPYFGNVLVLVL